jgi:hypothetical protein
MMAFDGIILAVSFANLNILHKVFQEKWFLDKTLGIKLILLKIKQESEVFFSLSFIYVCFSFFIEAETREILAVE